MSTAGRSPKVNIIIGFHQVILASNNIYANGMQSCRLLCTPPACRQHCREEVGCKKSQFSFKLTMTLGTILLFLIEAHIHDLKEFIECTCHTHITLRPGYVVHNPLERTDRHAQSLQRARI